MTLFIEFTNDQLQNKRLVAGLRAVCPDPGLGLVATNPSQLEVSDQLVVYPNQMMLDETCIRVWRLATSPIPVVIRGRAPGQTVYSIPQTLLGVTTYTDVKARDQPGHTGFTLPDPGQQVTSVDVIVEPSNDLDRGYWCLTVHDTKIAQPFDTILAHEFGHVEEVLDGIYHVGDDDEHREAGAIAAENVYRRRRGLPERWGHEGGNDLRKEQGGHTGGDCFVATAAYGSELEDDVQALRSLRDDVLIPTRAGGAFFADFFDQYYRLSPVIVEMMHADPQVREMVRWALVGPIVGFLRLADEFPRAELDGVPEPWNSYLSQVREHFERWAAHLPRPAAFDDIDPVQAAEELRITLRHLMWDPAESDRYLDDLTASGQLPLSAPSATLGALAHVLRSRGMDDGRIGAIIGHAPETP